MPDNVESSLVANNVEYLSGLEGGVACERTLGGEDVHRVCGQISRGDREEICLKLQLVIFLSERPVFRNSCTLC